MKGLTYQRTIFVLLAILVLSGCNSRTVIQEERSYLERRSEFETTLLYEETAPQPWEEEALPPRVEEVFYQSGELRLKAWVFHPEGDDSEQRPALIYYHGGFAFAAADMEGPLPFMEAGYVVMFPMLRGENGNPGNFELFWGEVDDANAAAQWLARQPYVDRDRIFAFGHSVGGAIAALLSLVEETPIRHSGSAGGIYSPGVFEAWDAYGLVPFDPTIAEEVRLRLLLGNIRYMQRRHYAFIGEEDSFAAVERLVEGETGDEASLLQVISVPGDHFSSLAVAAERYLEIVERSDGGG